MSLTEEEAQEIDRALKDWRQGDVSLDADLEFLHLADLSRPHSPASIQVANTLEEDGQVVKAEAAAVLDNVRGLVMLSQTCDIVRGCRDRPFVEVAPVVEVKEDLIEEIRRLKRPAFAYIPSISDDGLVADLDRVMTVEKALLARLTRTPGWETDAELRDFALALTRKRSRFPFPDDFVSATRKLQAYLRDKYNKQTAEGAHLRALDEIRVRAALSWADGEVHLGWWFIKSNDPEGVTVDWSTLLKQWLDRFDQTRRFRIDSFIACRLEDMTARDYVESDRLDLDSLSVA